MVDADGDGESFSGSVTVPLTGTDDDRWAYPRVLLDNGEVAWGSPVWIERSE